MKGKLFILLCVSLVFFLGISMTKAESGGVTEVAPSTVTTAAVEQPSGPLSTLLAKGLRITADPIILIRQDNEHLRLHDDHSR